MAVRIRLARQLVSRNNPSYTVVATTSTARATAKPLETLGQYRPLPARPTPVSVSPNGLARDPSEWGPGYAQSSDVGQVGEKRVAWNEHRVRHWLNLGAKPSKSVERLLNQAGILQSKPAPGGANAAAGGKKLVMSRERRIREAVRRAASTEAAASAGGNDSTPRQQ
ncbi:hypothetical protein JCM11491_001275 [Sporobolomyces phaffii]